MLRNSGEVVLARTGRVSRCMLKCYPESGPQIKPVPDSSGSFNSHYAWTEKGGVGVRSSFPEILDNGQSGLCICLRMAMGLGVVH